MLKNKICKKCKISKPCSEFYFRKDSKDSLSHECIVCLAVRMHKYYLRHKERIYRRVRNWIEMNWDKSNKYKRAYYKRNAVKEGVRNKIRKEKEPTKYQARYKLNNAIKLGRILRGTCGYITKKGVCGKKAQGHHDNYNKPYDVVWLCPRHHMQYHANLQNNQKTNI